MQDKYKAFEYACHNKNIILQKNVDLKSYCTFKIGGIADYLYEASDTDEIISLYKLSRDLDLPFYIIGRGSNLLISDQGLRGIVIVLTDKFAQMTEVSMSDLENLLTVYAQKSLQGEALINGKKVSLAETDLLLKYMNNKITGFPVSPNCCDNCYSDLIIWKVQAGHSLIDLSEAATAHSLTGLEFACGIPGTVGGAVYMNAGAYGNAVEDTVFITESIDREGRSHLFIADYQNFTYRNSYFAKHEHLIINVYFALRKADYEKIRVVVDDYTSRREQSQPLDMPSAGSVFKRPEGYYASKLIMDSQLQGFTIGQAQVSTKHAGFIVNLGGATAADVKKLIKHIQDTIYNKYSLNLETEIRFIGD